MEQLFIALVFAVAVFYIYRTMFKKKGCGCGKSTCDGIHDSSKGTKESD